MDIEFFTNDKFKVLSCMAEYQIDIAGTVIIPISQRQISEITGLAFKTVNTIIKELRNKDYILYEGTTRGKYSLTEKARKVLVNIKMES